MFTGIWHPPSYWFPKRLARTNLLDACQKRLARTNYGRHMSWCGLLERPHFVAIHHNQILFLNPFTIFKTITHFTVQCPHLARLRSDPIEIQVPLGCICNCILERISEVISIFAGSWSFQNAPKSTNCRYTLLLCWNMHCARYYKVS